MGPTTGSPDWQSKVADLLMSVQNRHRSGTHSKACRLAACCLEAHAQHLGACLLRLLGLLLHRLLRLLQALLEQLLQLRGLPLRLLLLLGLLRLLKLLLQVLHRLLLLLLLLLLGLLHLLQQRLHVATRAVGVLPDGQQLAQGRKRHICGRFSQSPCCLAAARPWASVQNKQAGWTGTGSARAACKRRLFLSLPGCSREA